MAKRVWVAVYLLLASANTLACSGSNVQGTIANHNLIAKSFVALLVLEGLLSWLLLRRCRHGIGHPALFLILLLANPGVWDRGVSGDCGATMVMGSFLFVVVGGALTLAQLGSFWRRSKTPIDN